MWTLPELPLLLQDHIVAAHALPGPYISAKELAQRENLDLSLWFPTAAHVTTSGIG
jgi:hypothetical protein